MAISFQLRFEIFFIADARINTATDIPTIKTAALPAPVAFTSSLSNADIAPTNSKNKTVIPARAEPSLSESIVDKTHNDAAKIPIEIAIFLIMSVFMFFCQAVKESPTVPKTSLIESTKLLPSPAKSLNPLIHFLRPSKIVVNIPPLTRSKRDFISPLRKAFPKALPMLEATFMTAAPTFLIDSNIEARILANVSKPGVSNFPFT